MRRYFSIILSFLMLGLCLFTQPAMAQTDPVNLLNSIADQMISELKSKQATLKNNPSLVYSLANRIIVPHADMEEMSKRVLPPAAWNSATPSQRKQFEKEFTSLMVRTYASALANYKDQTVKFYPVRGGYEGKSDVRVDSQVLRSDGPSIAMNYRLVWKGSQWKVYDMTVEGISLLASFRSQFADKLAHGDMTALLNDLSQHNAGR